MKKSVQLLEAIGRAEATLRTAEAEAEGAREDRVQVIYCEAMKSVRETFRAALTEWEAGHS